MVKMGRIGEMDNKGFRAMFNFKVDEAKSKYRASVMDNNREEKLKKLREKITFDVKEEFIKAIPEVINPFEECIISSNWIRVDINDGYYIAFVFFADKTKLECFFADIAEELTAILGKAVQVDEQEPKNHKLRRFSVKV